MKKTLFSEKELKLLLILISLMILSGSYFLVFNRFHAKTEAMREENLERVVKLRELKNMALSQKKVETQIQEMKAESQQIIDRMPSLVTQEKAIYIIDEMEKSIGVEILSIGFSMNEVLGTNSQKEESTEQQTTENITEPITQEPQLTGYCSTLQLQYKASYAQLKEMIHYIANYEDRMTLESINSSFDMETGNLFGTMEVKMYSIEGTNREYEPPVIYGISQGVNNIMRSKSN